MVVCRRIILMNLRNESITEKRRVMNNVSRNKKPLFEEFDNISR